MMTIDEVRAAIDAKTKVWARQLTGKVLWLPGTIVYIDTLLNPPVAYVNTERLNDDGSITRVYGLYTPDELRKVSG